MTILKNVMHWLAAFNVLAFGFLFIRGLESEATTGNIIWEFVYLGVILYYGWCFMNPERLSSDHH